MQPFGHQVRGYIITKLRLVHIVRSIFLVRTHQVPYELIRDSMNTLRFPICLGMEDNGKP